MGSQALPSSFATLEDFIHGSTIVSRLSKLILSPPLRTMIIVMVVQYHGLTIYPWIVAGSLCTASLACIFGILRDGLYDAFFIDYLYQSLMVQLEYLIYTLEFYGLRAAYRSLALLQSPTMLIAQDGMGDVIKFSCWVAISLLDHRVEQFALKCIIKVLRAPSLVLARLWTFRSILWAFLPTRDRHLRSNASEPLNYRHEYAALADGEIRLLVLPRRASCLPVKVRMITVNLKEAPSYEAISYTWGASKRTREIMVNDRPFTTSAAVYDVLRGRSSIWRSRLIWIDYICINQDDLEEKALQVTQMIEVYRKAVKVVVWLHGFSFDITTFNCLAMMHSLLCMLAQGKSLMHMYILLRFQTTKPRWQAFLKACDHAWFSRIWIIQETSVANKIFFSYGGFLFSWDSFLQLSVSLLSTDLQVLFDPTPQSRRVRQNFESLVWIQATRSIIHHNRMADGINEIKVKIGKDPHPILWKEFNAVVATYRKVYPSSMDNNNDIIASHRLTLAHLLTAYGGFNATDARDKIYALRGLVTDSLTRNTEPNYSNKSVETLYIDVARTVWESADPFGIVGWAGIGLQRNLVLPSFVPDWTCPPIPIVPLTSACYRHEQASVQYNASGSTQAEVVFALSDDRPVLELDGAFVDSVMVLCKMPPAPEERNDDDLSIDTRLMMIAIKEWHDEVKTSMMKSFGGLGASGLHETLWRTLLCDKKGTMRPAPSEMQEEYETWVDLLNRYDKGDFGSNTVLTSAQRDFMKKLADLSWARHMGGACVGRHFGITVHGRAGMFPASTEVGDPIFIAHGASTPWVLRNNGSPGLGPSKPVAIESNSFLLVGECYVHDIMDGEAFDGEHQVKHVRIW